MSDEAEFVYNTRLRARSISTDFHGRLANALMRDFGNGSDDEEEEDRSHEEDVSAYMPNEDASDIEDDLVIEPDENFESDDEEEGERQDVGPEETETCMYGKDGTKWEKEEPNTATRVRQHNLMRFKSGPKDENSIPVEVFKKFYTENISFIIITQTNRHAREFVRKFNEENPGSANPLEWKDMTNTELNALIGILFAAGISNNNTQKATELWHMNALPIFRAAMSYNRSIAILRFIRFDDSRTREFRQQTDKAAPIRDIWNYLNENLAKNYDPHENITIDEQLFPYRGRTKFTQFIPSKPAKYGIKVWWACDSKTKYPLQGKLYTGKADGGQRETNQGENVLLQLSGRYSNSGRTIVADNFFTTLNGAKRLASLGLAYVGTVRADKPFLPEQCKKKRSRPVLSSIFGFHENLVSLCSYVPKKNKAVNLLSTVHYTKLCEGEKMKPEAILYYNKSKIGVDCMDQMVTHFTTKRPTRRWTLAFFFNMLDVMALASYCICKEIDRNNNKNARKQFLQNSFQYIGASKRRRSYEQCSLYQAFSCSFSC